MNYKNQSIVKDESEDGGGLPCSPSGVCGIKRKNFEKKTENQNQKNQGKKKFKKARKDGGRDSEFDLQLALLSCGIGNQKLKTPEDITIMVDNTITELNFAAQRDADQNRKNKPATNKLMKLSLLTNSLLKKPLQREFLDRGVLTLLKNWLEPLPDRSLPNITIRAAVLRILSELPIDLEDLDRREQVKKSGIGKVVMFLSKSEEETTENRKLATNLVNQWSRPIFNNSIRFEDLRKYEEEKAAAAALRRRTSSSSEESKSSSKSSSPPPGSGSGSGSERASRPEALVMDFLVRPRSKIVAGDNNVRLIMGNQLTVTGVRRLSINDKLKKLKAVSLKREPLQAFKLSADGRNLVKCF